MLKPMLNRIIFVYAALTNLSKKHEVRSTLQKQKLLFTEFVDLLHLGITFFCVKIVMR